MSKSKKHIVWFGMKVSPEEKEKIKKLAKVMGTSQKEAVMSLVEDRIAEYGDASADTGLFMQEVEQYSALFDGPEDLSSNKKHLKGYGTKSMS